MDAFAESARAALREKKRAFAASQAPPIEPCVNDACGFPGCVCGSACGCGGAAPPEPPLVVCDPCVEARRQAGK